MQRRVSAGLGRWRVASAGAGATLAPPGAEPWRGLAPRGEAAREARWRVRRHRLTRMVGRGRGHAELWWAQARQVTPQSQNRKS